MTIPSEIETGLNQLATDLLREDDLGVVVRAHIRIENVLKEFVELSLFHPKHLKKMDLDFDKTVSLAMALGLIEDLGAPLNTMGSLRNHFAHNIDTNLDQAKVTALYNNLGTRDKNLAQDLFVRLSKEFQSSVKRMKNLPIRDQFIICALVLWTNMQIAVIQLRQEIGHA